MSQSRWSSSAGSSIDSPPSCIGMATATITPRNGGRFDAAVGCGASGSGHRRECHQTLPFWSICVIQISREAGYRVAAGAPGRRRRRHLHRRRGPPRHDPERGVVADQAAGRAGRPRVVAPDAGVRAHARRGGSASLRGHHSRGSRRGGGAHAAVGSDRRDPARHQRGPARWRAGRCAGPVRPHVSRCPPARAGPPQRGGAELAGRRRRRPRVDATR